MASNTTRRFIGDPRPYDRTVRVGEFNEDGNQVLGEGNQPVASTQPNLSGYGFSAGTSAIQVAALLLGNANKPITRASQIALGHTVEFALRKAIVRSSGVDSYQDPHYGYHKSARSVLWNVVRRRADEGRDAPPFDGDKAAWSAWGKNLIAEIVDQLTAAREVLDMMGDDNTPAITPNPSEFNWG